MQTKMKKIKSGKKLNAKSHADFTKGLKSLVESETDMFNQGSTQVKSLAKYLKNNWKTVAPALAALGIGAVLHKYGTGKMGMKKSSSATTR